MSNSYRRIGLLSGCAIAMLAWHGWGFPPVAKAVDDPSELLPAETVLYLRADGTAGHEEAFEQTAAYQALYTSGLIDALKGAFSSVESNPNADGLTAAFKHVMEHGFSFAIAVDSPDPGPFAVWGVIVVPQAGEGVDLLESLIDALEEKKLKVRNTKIGSRKVKYIEIPDAPVDLGWWNEDDDLVIAFGMNGIASAIAVADEKRPNLSENELFKRYSDVSPEFEITETLWFDIKTLREMFGGIPLPVNEGEDPIPLQTFIETLGLETLEHVAVLSGFRDEAIWTETVLEAPGERKGVMALLDQPVFKIDEIPAIPLHHLGVAITSFDWGPSTENILTVVRNTAGLIRDVDPQKIDEAFDQFETEYGFHPQEFFNSLGSLNCLYADAGQGGFGLGSIAMVNVKDAPKLTSCIKKILAVIQKEVNGGGPLELIVKETVKDDQTRFQLLIPKAAVIQPTISVDENWLMIGLMPQAVEAQHRRMAGDIFSWSLQDDIGDALELLPEEITSLSIVDPAASYKTLIGFAPSFLGLLEMGLRQDGKLAPDQPFPIDLGELPPAELVTEPLFLNIAVSTVDDHGVQTYSRQSLPAVPLFGATTTGGAAVVADTATEPTQNSSTQLVRPMKQAPHLTYQWSRGYRLLKLR